MRSLKGIREEVEKLKELLLRIMLGRMELGTEVAVMGQGRSI